MDKRIILAVAGSGKTTNIINNLNIKKRCLLITYTRNNLENLRFGIIKRFGYIPDNIYLFTYYSFLHSFCCLPYLKDVYNTKGVLFKTNNNRYSKGYNRFISHSKRFYYNRLSKFLEYTDSLVKVLNRIRKYFDCIYIDEVQDFAGHDFNFLMDISKIELPMLYVGDFYQHTYDTGRDGNVNSTLHDDYEKYKNRFEEIEFIVDTSSLNKSYRCKPNVCQFVTDNLDIPINSHSNEIVKIDYCDDEEEIQRLLVDDRLVKLFYQKHYQYAKFARNWGDCKGENRYQDICVVLNPKTLSLFKSGRLNELPAVTRNKLYVAITRAKRNVVMVPEEIVKKIVCNV